MGKVLVVRVRWKRFGIQGQFFAISSGQRRLPKAKNGTSKIKFVSVQFGAMDCKTERGVLWQASAGISDAGF
jgi:hypothetical protein